MMSVLLLTLFDVVHCHPVPIGSVSLLPVVYVEGSLVLRTTLPPLSFVLKSAVSSALLKNCGSAALVVPSALNNELQSTGCVVPPTFVVVDASTSPSSWNASSCTALADVVHTNNDTTIASKPTAAAPIRVECDQPKRRLRGRFAGLWIVPI